MSRGKTAFDATCATNDDIQDFDLKIQKIFLNDSNFLNFPKHAK